jgi:hypothetical protein
MLWLAFLISMMVGRQHQFGVPFALLTCSKCEQLFSKLNDIVAKKFGRTSGIDWCAKKACHTKVLTQPPYQINVATTLIEVKQEVLVYVYIHNRIRRGLSQYFLKNVCLAKCLKLVPGTCRYMLSNNLYADLLLPDMLIS